MGIENLQVCLSGGAANADPTLSTGGVKSSTVVLSQAATIAASIPGVTIYNAAGNIVGIGSLSYGFSGKTLAWTSPGETISGAQVNVGTNGRYLIRGSGVTNGYVIVDVVSATLSSNTNHTQSVTVTNQTALMLPAVGKDTAYAGATEYYLYYLSNDSASTIKSVSIQIQTDTPGVDTLSLAVVSAKNTAEILADAPGHSYSVVGVTLSMGDLLTADYWGFWIKRVTPALTTDGVVNNTFKLRVTALT